MNENGGRGHPHLAPDLREKEFSLSPLGIILAVDIFADDFHQVEGGSLYFYSQEFLPSFLNVMNSVEFCQMLFCINMIDFDDVTSLNFFRPNNG